MTLRLPCVPWTVPKSVRSASAQKAPTTIRIGSIQLNAGRREVSIRRLRRARAVLAACGVPADGNRVLVRLAPRTREDTARLPGVLPGSAPAPLA